MACRRLLPPPRLINDELWALNTPRKVQIAQQLYNDKSNTVADICRTLRISRATLYRYLETGTGKPS